MNLIDQAKTIMQEIKDRDLALDNWKSDNMGITRAFAEAMLWVSKEKASQMLIDLTNEKEFLESQDIKQLVEWADIGCAHEDYEPIINRLKEINSAIEILEERAK
jgi:uncharacterized protein YjiK